MDRLLQSILAAAPSGTSPYDALRQYFDKIIFGHNSGFIGECYGVMAISGLVVVTVVAGFLVRLSSARLSLMLKDGAMTRLDHRVYTAGTFAVYGSMKIVMSAFLVRAYRNKHFTRYDGAAQLYDTVLLAFCAHVIFMNIVANNPRVRAILTPAGGPYTSSSRHGPLLLAIGTLVPCVAILAAIVPAVIRLINSFADISARYDDIMRGINLAESLDSLPQLQAGLPIVMQLQNASKKSSDVLVFTGRFYSAFIAFWLIVGSVQYIYLDRAVRRKIGNLEERLFAEGSQRSRDIPTYVVTDIALPKQEDEPALQGLGPVDRPFANLVKTSPIPQRYQAVLDVSSQESSTKVKQLRSLLREDALHHFFILCIVLGYFAETIYQGAKGHEHIAQQNIIPMFYAWNAWAFLIPGLPVAALFLRDSIRMARRQRSQQPQLNLPMSKMTFDIPLASLADEEKLGSPRAGGIQVSQVAMVTVEESKMSKSGAKMGEDRDY